MPARPERVLKASHLGQRGSAIRWSCSRIGSTWQISTGDAPPINGPLAPAKGKEIGCSPSDERWRRRKARKAKAGRDRAEKRARKPRRGGKAARRWRVVEDSWPRERL